MEFEYDRHGTLAYFGAYDVHRARLMGRVEPTTGIAPFGALVDQVMTTEPYASARRVFWVVDNGSSHAGQALDRPDARGVADRDAGAPAGARLLAEPDRDRVLGDPTQGHHARRLRRPRRPRPAADRVRTPLQRHRDTLRLAFTRADLDDLLARLDAHRPAGACRRWRA